eukprot:m51a1_g6406 putative ras guanine nucleotide exchange factor (1270) ;mRNA; r:240816-248433
MRRGSLFRAQYAAPEGECSSCRAHSASLVRVARDVLCRSCAVRLNPRRGCRCCLATVWDEPDTPSAPPSPPGPAPEALSPGHSRLKLKKCGRCLACYYCSEACQRADWPRHKTECQPPARLARDRPPMLSILDVPSHLTACPPDDFRLLALPPGFGYPKCLRRLLELGEPKRKAGEIGVLDVKPTPAFARALEAIAAHCMSEPTSHLQNAVDGICRMIMDPALWRTSGAESWAPYWASLVLENLSSAGTGRMTTQSDVRPRQCGGLPPSGLPSAESVRQYASGLVPRLVRCHACLDEGVGDWVEPPLEMALSRLVSRPEHIDAIREVLHDPAYYFYGRGRMAELLGLVAEMHAELAESCTALLLVPVAEPRCIDEFPAVVADCAWALAHVAPEETRAVVRRAFELNCVDLSDFGGFGEWLEEAGLVADESDAPADSADANKMRRGAREKLRKEIAERHREQKERRKAVMLSPAIGEALSDTSSCDSEDIPDILVSAADTPSGSALVSEASATGSVRERRKSVLSVAFMDDTDSTSQLSESIGESGDSEVVAALSSGSEGDVAAALEKAGKKHHEGSENPKPAKGFLRKWKRRSLEVTRYVGRFAADMDLLRREIEVEEEADSKATRPRRPSSPSGKRKVQCKSLTDKYRPRSGKPKTFGVDLEELVNAGGQILFIPKIVDKFISHFENIAELFDSKQDAVQSAVTRLAEDIDSKGVVDFTEVSDNRVVVGLFLEFFDKLPTPLVPYSLQPQFLQCTEGANDAVYSTNVLLPAVWSLPECNRAVLQHVISSLRLNFLMNPRIDRDKALEVIPNCLGPLVLRSEKAAHTNACETALVVRSMLLHYESVFQSTGEIIYEVAADGEHALVKQASLRMLLEKLADEHYHEEVFPYHILLTYQYFATHEELRARLFELHTSVSESCEGDAASWRRRKQERIARIICRWARLRGEELSSDAPQVVQQLCEHFGKNCVTESQTVEDFLAGIKKPVLQFDMAKDSADEGLAKLLQGMDARELAEQITSFHWTLLRAVPLGEFLRKKAGCKDKGEPTEHLQALVDACNRLTGWAVSEMVTSESAATIERIIQIASCCLKLRNFNATFALNAALQHSAVSRLAAWESVRRSKVSRFEEVKKLFSLDFNYREYRQVLAQARLPAIPCLIMITHDIFAIEEIMSTFVTEHTAVPLVNCEKTRGVGAILSQIRQFQRVPYHKIAPNQDVFRALHCARVLPDELLYKRRRDQQKTPDPVAETSEQKPPQQQAGAAVAAADKTAQ